MKRITTGLILFLLLVSSALPALAQGDDRYAGYSGPQVVWPNSSPPQVTGSYYQPSYFDLSRKKVNVAQTVGLEADAKVFMLTATGWRWVLQKAGTLFDFDRAGRPLYRHDCGNPAPAIAYLQKKPPLVPHQTGEAVMLLPAPPPLPVFRLTYGGFSLQGNSGARATVGINNPTAPPPYIPGTDIRISSSTTGGAGGAAASSTGPITNVNQNGNVNIQAGATANGGSSAAASGSGAITQGVNP